MMIKKIEAEAQKKARAADGPVIEPKRKKAGEDHPRKRSEDDDDDQCPCTVCIERPVAVGSGALCAMECPVAVGSGGLCVSQS